MSLRLFKNGYRCYDHFNRINWIHLSRSPTHKSQVGPNPKIRTNLQSGANINDLKNDLRLIMGLETTYKMETNLGKNEQLNAYLARDASDLPIRTIKDSFLSAIIPLSTDEKLHNKYLSNLGNVRYGRLIEDMDIFAVMVVQKYILNPKVPIYLPSPYNVVTILMDSAIVHKYSIDSKEDVRISGHISNVGRTSAEVVVWLEQQKSKGNWKNFMQAKFVLAARDANNLHGAVINKLQPENAVEWHHVKSAQFYRQRNANKKNLSRPTLPTVPEQALLHQLYIKATHGKPYLPEEALPMGCRWCSETSHSNIILSFPENRNLHNTIFGGYIMRQAIELGFATCFLYTKSRPRLLGIGEVKFQRPIPVGAIIRMHAKIAYIKKRLLQVTIRANAINHQDATEIATNTFQFTFEVANEVQDVFPRTYAESIEFIDAARNMETMLKLNKTPFHYVDFNKM